MLLIGIICLLVATLALAVSSCFVSTNKTLTFLLKALALISLASVGIACANYKNNFSGYAIFIILAILPQFLTLFDLKNYLAEKKIELQNLLAEDEMQNSDEKNSDENSTQPAHTSEEKQTRKAPSKAKVAFWNSNGMLLTSIGFLLTAVCLSLSALYVGLETYYGFLIGLALAFAMFFAFMIVKKSVNFYDGLGMFLIFLAVGILIGQIVIVLLCAIDLINILFCVGLLLCAIYFVLSVRLKSKYDHIAFFVSILAILATLII